MSDAAAPVHTDCPICQECEAPCGTPVALDYSTEGCAANLLRCAACGSQWEELDIARVAQAWWAAGADEARRRADGEDARTWSADIRWCLL